MAKILIVDDEAGIRELLSEILSDEGHDILQAENAAEARQSRNAARPDLVLLDIWMPDTDGITLLKEWSANGQLTMPVIMMSGHGTIDTAVEATRIGAMDYLEKPIALQKLLTAVKRGLQKPGALGQTSQLTLAAFPRSAPLSELRRRLQQLALKSRLLLLRSGPASIAELAARSLKPDATGWLDLASVTQPLDIKQLQGIQGGVLYVPELQRLSRNQQRNLAFAIERLDRFNLHLAALTEHAAETLMAEGWDDALVKKLFEVSFSPPSLVELRDELPDLANQVLLHQVEAGEVPRRRLTTAALNLLRTHPWPGGYVELRAAVKSLALGTLNEEIDTEDVRRVLPEPVQPSQNAISLDQPLREAREAFERMYFEHQLSVEGTNMTRIAEKSGLERTHLYRKLKQLGIQVGRKSDPA